MAFDGLRLSVGLLSVFPVRPVTDVRPATAGRAMVLAPVAVAPLALLTGLVCWLGGAVGLPGPVVGLLVVGTPALGTRALHLDGLADTVDGLGSGQDRERALAVMRRGDVGPMGVVALVLVLGLQAAAVAALPRTPAGAAAVVVAVAASRCAFAPTCRRGVPAARPEGLGALVASNVGTGPAVLVVVVGLGLTTAAGVLVGGWEHGLVAGLVAALAAWAVGAHAVRRFGGITGDVLGAVLETTLTALLVALAT